MKYLLMLVFVLSLAACGENGPSADIDDVRLDGNTLTFDLTTSNGEMIENYDLRIMRGETLVHQFEDSELSTDGLLYDIKVHALSPGDHVIEAVAHVEGEDEPRVIGEHAFTFELPSAAPEAWISGDPEITQDTITFDLDFNDPEDTIDGMHIMLYDEEGTAVSEITDSDVQTMSNHETQTYNKELYFTNLESATEYSIHIYSHFNVDDETYRWVIMDDLTFTTE